MCEPGRLWSDLYFEWMNHAAVFLVMLSENYFHSSACRAEFENAMCQQVPDSHSQDRIVVPLVVSAASLLYAELRLRSLILASSTPQAIPSWLMRSLH